MSGHGLTGGEIVGWTQESSNVLKCSNSGTVHLDISSGATDNGGALGGITGMLISSTINQCYNTGKITSKYNNDYRMNNSGGLVGFGYQPTIKNTYNTGEIYGLNNVGGIYGCMTGGYSYNCYNASSKIEGSSNVGTYCGYAQSVTGSYNITISNTTGVGGNDGRCNYTFAKSYTLAEMKSTSSGMLTWLLNGEGAGLWAQDTKNDGLPYLINNLPR